MSVLVLEGVSVTMASNDDISLKHIISQKNSENHYRAISKEEYEKLLKRKADNVQQTPSNNPKLQLASVEAARPRLSPRVSLSPPPVI